MDDISVFETIKAGFFYLMCLISVFSYLSDKMKHDAECERNAIEIRQETTFWKNVKKGIIRAAFFFFVFWMAATFIPYFEAKTVWLLRDYAVWLFVYALIISFCYPSKKIFSWEDVSKDDLKAFDMTGKERKRKYLKDLKDFARRTLRYFWVFLFLTLQIFVAQETVLSYPTGQEYFPYIVLIALYILSVVFCFYGDYFIGHNVIDRRNFYLKSGKVFIAAACICLLFFEYDFMPCFVLVFLLLFIASWYSWEYNNAKVTAILRLPYLWEEHQKKEAEWEQMLAELEADADDWDEDEDEDEDEDAEEEFENKKGGE